MALGSILLAASIASSVTNLYFVRANPSLPRTATKTLATALLAAVVADHQGPSILALALLLGSIGDALLAWSDDDTVFLGGLSSFLCAHVLYTNLFLREGGGLPQIQADTWRQWMAAVMLLAGPVFNVLLFSNTGPTLRVPVLVYSAVILGMYLSALTLDNVGLISAALLFTLSDMVLATERFLLAKASYHRAWMQYAVWVLYYTGQLLIALSLVEHPGLHLPGLQLSS